MNVTLPKFVTLSLSGNPVVWSTHDSDNLDDAMSEDAQVILQCEQGSGMVRTRAGSWQKIPYAAAHEEMRKLQQKFKPMMLIRVVQTAVDLEQILGLGEANASNTPNTPVDPRLTGESPFGDDDPFWYDYRKDQ